MEVWAGRKRERIGSHTYGRGGGRCENFLKPAPGSRRWILETKGSPETDLNSIRRSFRPAHGALGGEQAWRGLPDLEGTAAGGGDVRGGRRRSWAGRWQET